MAHGARSLVEKPGPEPSQGAREPEPWPVALLWSPGTALRTWSWLLVPGLFVVMTTLAVVRPQGAYGSPELLTALNLLFFTLGSAFVAWVVARAFLARGSPGLLVLGAGVVAFGATSVVASVLGSEDPNRAVTIHNVGVLLAGACHVAATVLMVRVRRPVGRVRRALPVAYGASVAVNAAVALLAGAGALPTFFVQGQGGTPLRQAVLGLAIASFATASGVMAGGSAHLRSAFRHWYAVGLALVAVGLYGVLVQSAYSSPLGWLGRGAQYLGSTCMLVAAVAAVREAAGSALPLDALLRQTEARYRALFENMTEGFFLAQVICDAAGKPVDYRYLDANPAFEVLTGLARREVIGRTVREVLPGAEREWIEAYGQVALTGEPTQLERHAAALGRTYLSRAYSPNPGQFACLFADVTEERRAAERVRRSEERLRALADSMPQLAWTVGPDGVVTWFNRRWYEYTGTSPAERPASGWQAAHDPRTLPEVLRRWSESIAAGTALEMEFPLRGADGRYRRFLTRVEPLKDEAGAVLQWFGTSTDVTELVEVQEALRQADRRKDEFLAVLSHELRNPLAPIRTSIALLDRAPPGSPPAARAREILRRQTDHMTRLVEDLLDVTRISRGKIALQRARIDLCEVVRRTSEDLRPLFEEAQVEFRVELPALPVWVEADPTRMAQVMGNLLHNAVKFTPAGGMTQVSLRALDGAAEVAVRDSGAGIRPEDLKRLFEPFAQAEQDVARSKGGLGLGLALARAIVELHGGTVGARSEGAGRGAEFTVRLPAMET